jgi:integrase
MKGGKAHKVPLAKPVLEILRALPREANNPWLFIGNTKGNRMSNNMMLKLLKRLDEHVTVHGFRSTFMDWAHEQTAYPKTVIDMALAHVVGDKVEAAYRRGDLFDKRTRLMTEWAKYCFTPRPEAKTEGKVIAMRQGA